jgi:hypothetical protein
LNEILLDLNGAYLAVNSRYFCVYVNESNKMYLLSVRHI